ncbi:hypothetical protein GF412_01050 [Candidatus Micrarchaeota archaeon]|nr:hypothetical protein [Candidatus Micrarchaeota archaeon]MBD3417560.1 hypothetical protein [Candidatus Micrarchaeota archaeon]
MKTHLAFSMRAKAKPRRGNAKRQVLNEEIMRFAARVRPRITDRRDSAVHKELSGLIHRMGYRELKEFKKRIQGGGEDGLFPVSRVMEREGDAARRLADFLGPDYVGLMEGLARSRGDIHNVSTGKKYLEWAAKHGGREVEVRALAGIAGVSADEVADGNGHFVERENIKRNGIMRVLSSKIGEKEAWGIVKGMLEAEKKEKKVVSAISFLAGACISASIAIIQGARGVGDMPTMVMLASGIAGAAAGISFIAKKNIWIVQRKINRLLVNPPGDGHV